MIMSIFQDKILLITGGSHGIPVPDYADDVSNKVVKIIQNYLGVVNKMEWRKKI